MQPVTALLGTITLLCAFTAFGNTEEDTVTTPPTIDTTRHTTIGLFGATGTIGDGLLKAAMLDPEVDKIHVITRRSSPRIEAGVESGKVIMTIHRDYQDYTAIREVLAEVDAVFWAIGLSAMGLDEETYREIHVAYPRALLTEWLALDARAEGSFHLVSGAGAGADSRMMWAREKARAESELSSLARDSKLRVISYRPSVILPTETEAHLGHQIMYRLLSPFKSAVAAQSIGEAMLEISARGPEVENGTILENRDILSYSEAYALRQ